MNENGNLRRGRIVGQQIDLLVNCSRGRIRQERDDEVVIDIDAGATRFHDAGLQVFVFGHDVQNFPIGPPGIVDLELALEFGSDFHRPEVDRAGSQYQVTADINLHRNAHGRRLRLVKRHGDRRTLLPREFVRIDRDLNVRRVPGFHGCRIELRSCAAARCGDTRNPHVLLIHVFHSEAMNDLGILRDGTEIVRQRIEHRLRPVLSTGRRGAEQHNRKKQQDTSMARAEHRSLSITARATRDNRLSWAGLRWKTAWLSQQGTRKHPPDRLRRFDLRRHHDGR
jgi:hypothetical protein